MSDMYLCEPARNKACSKTACFINGGPCHHTVNAAYQQQPNGDRLATMLMMQKGFQESLYPDLATMSVPDRVAYIKEHSLHLNQEINEMLYELPYFKPWKDYSGVTSVDIAEAFQKARMELIDAWHFFMNMALMLGFTPEMFFDMYTAKNEENYRRQADGYTHDKSYRSQSVEEVLHEEH